MLEFPKIADAPNFTPPPGQEWIFLQPATWPGWTWLLLAVGLLLLGVSLYLTLRRTHIQLPPAPPLATHVMAMTLLEDLRPLASELPAQELAARVKEIIRTYLHRQFGILARFRTTQEILDQRRNPSLPPPAPAIKTFEDFLMRADALNYGGGDDAPQTFIDEAIDAIRQSHDHLIGSATR